MDTLAAPTGDVSPLIHLRRTMHHSFLARAEAVLGRASLFKVTRTALCGPPLAEQEPSAPFFSRG
jgi:hypothetical protein